MKRLFYFLIIALTALSVSCRKEFDDSAIWDEIYDLEQRVANLEKQVNTNIKSIQQLAEAAQSYDYVKSITPITENGKVIGQGNHEELMENCETYREIYKSQMGLDLKEDQNGGEV